MYCYWNTAVAKYDSHDYIVAWDNRQGDIYAQRIDENGNKIDNEFMVNTSFGYNRNPQIASNVDDIFCIIWLSPATDGELIKIQGQLFNSACQKINNEFTVVSYSPILNYGRTDYIFPDINPKIAMDENGNYVVTWEEVTQQDWLGHISNVYAKIYNRNGTIKKNKFRVNTYTQWPQYYPGVGMDKQGNFIICWSGYEYIFNPGYRFTVRAQRFNLNGNRVGNEFRADDCQPDICSTGQGKQSVAMSLNGYFAIAYDRDNSEYLVRIFDSLGNSVGKSISLDMRWTEGNISFNNDNLVVTSWETKGQDLQYYAQILTKDGEKIGNKIPINNPIKDSASGGYPIGIFLNSVNDFICAWQYWRDDDRGSNVVVKIVTQDCFNSFMDCNKNGTDDDKDISSGASRDTNNNTIPDECEPTLTQLQIYDPAKVQFVEMQPDVQAQLFNKDFGTIVMTHGWNGGEPSSGWMAETARVLYERMGEAVNILAWDWNKESATGIQFLQAVMNILPQSRLCAKELRKVLSLDYNKPVHFMGHSLGSFLMANVCEMTLPLRPKVGDKVVPTHLTLWDPPDLVKNDLGNQILRLRKTGVYADLISGSADDKAYFVNAWIDVPVSERNLLNFYHDVYLWYQNHATLAENPLLFGKGCNQDPVDKNIGFNASVLFETGAKSMDFTCLLPNGPISTSYVCHIDSCDRLNYRIFGLACVDDKTPEKKITGIILSTGECFGSCELPSDTKALLKKAAREGAGGDVAPDTTFTLTQTIDLQWDYVSFTYEFSEIGNSQLMLSIESDGTETPIWLDNAVTDKGPNDSGLIDVQEYRGKTVDFIFGFFAGTDASTVAVFDVSFWQDPFHNNLPPTILVEGGDLLAILANGESTAIALDASNSTDPNNDSLSFIWENKDGVIEVQPRIELNLAPGAYQYTVTVRDPFDGITQKTVLREVEYDFMRGDANQDKKLNIADPISTLGWLFLGSVKEICVDAADADDDDKVNIADAIYTLSFLFLGGPAPKNPYPNPGLDPSPDKLGCELKS